MLQPCQHHASEQEHSTPWKHCSGSQQQPTNQPTKQTKKNKTIIVSETGQKKSLEVDFYAEEGGTILRLEQPLGQLSSNHEAEPPGRRASGVIPCTGWCYLHAMQTVTANGTGQRTDILSAVGGKGNVALEAEETYL